ncbi:MAG: hypothetical protein WC337_02480 [Candidatus Muiribacteriota bacterium]
MIYSLIITVFSSIIFFVVAYSTNDERTAMIKTMISLPAFFVVYLAIIVIINAVLPGSITKEEEKKSENIDYIFPDIRKKQ